MWPKRSVEGWQSLLTRALRLPASEVLLPKHFSMVNLKTNAPAARYPPPKQLLGKQSAVLVLLQPSGTSPSVGADGEAALLRHGALTDMSILLTMRCSTMRTHGGQISFPGGRLDGDETAEAGAVRECMEEVGVGKEAFEVVGNLKPVWSAPSKSWVTPVVAIAHQQVSAHVCSPEEVASLHYLRLGPLMGNSVATHHQLVKHFSNAAYGSLRFPCFFASDSPDVAIVDGVHPHRGVPVAPVDVDYGLTPVTVDQCDGVLVWGLTAAILCELIARTTHVANAEMEKALYKLQASPFVVRDPDLPAGDNAPMSKI